MADNAPPVPQSLRPIAHYVNIAKENASRDPIVYYWCLFYAVQTGMGLDKESKEALMFLTSLLSTLENVKKHLAGQEAISQDIVAQAHIENFAMKLFEYADKNDRQSNYSKGVVKAFYTAGYLIDVLTLFGELDENLITTRKYAKWKAAYIGSCLKKGEIPTPGPPSEQNEDELNSEAPSIPKPGGANPAVPPAGDFSVNAGSSTFVHSESHQKPVVPSENSSTVLAASSATPGPNNGGLTVEDFLEAQKFAKYAISALSYEDVKSAIENLEKAIAILKKS